MDSGLSRYEILFAPDGQVFLTLGERFRGSGFLDLTFWQPSPLKILERKIMPLAGTDSIEAYLSAGGRYLLAPSYGDVALWETKKLDRLNIPRMSEAQFTPRGDAVIGVRRLPDEGLVVWDIARRRERGKFENTRPQGRRYPELPWVLTPDGSLVLTGATKGLGVWSMKDGRSVFQLPGSRFPGAASHGGQYWAVTEGTKVSVYKSAVHSPVGGVSIPDGTAKKLEFAPDDAALVIEYRSPPDHRDRVILVTDLASGAHVSVDEGFIGFCGDSLITARDRKYALRDWTSGRKKSQYEMPRFETGFMARTTSDGCAVVRTDADSITIVNLLDGKTKDWNAGPILAISPDDSLLVTLNRDDSLTTWELPELRPF